MKAKATKFEGSSLTAAGGPPWSTRRAQWCAPAIGVCIALIVTCWFPALAATDPATLVTSGRPDRGYSFETIDPPFGEPGVDMIVQILWLNDRGVITAQYQSPPADDFFDNMHTAILERGAWTVLDIPGALTTGGTNANNHGEVGLTHAFEDGVWRLAIDDGRGLESFPDIPGYPGGIITQTINERGHIAAGVIDAEGRVSGLVGDADEYTIFDVPDPGTVDTWAFMVNNRAVAVGQYFLGDGTVHAFKLDAGVFTNIDPPGYTNSYAAAIDSSGVIVGGYFDLALGWVGFVLDRGRYSSLRVPGATQTLPIFINNRGQISGSYADAAGVSHGFVATPLPGK